MRSLAKLLRRIPFTLLMLAGLAVGGLVTNTYFDQITRHWLNRVGFSAHDLWYWRLGRLFTSALVTTGGLGFWVAVWMVALAVGLAEWMAGWKRIASTFWGVHLLTLLLLSVIVLLAMHPLRNFGLAADSLARDVGPSAGYVACLGVVSARLKRPWPWITGGVLLAALFTALFLPAAVGDNITRKFSADLAHLLAFPLGWLSARLGRRA